MINLIYSLCGRNAAPGANSHGQLGQGVLSEQCALPREVDLSGCGLRPEAVRKIVGGGGHTLILDAAGRIYSCGRNDQGQAGVAERSSGRNVSSTFRRLSFLRDDATTAAAVDVCCGWNSSAALTHDGDLYLWGSNRHGQLGDDPAICSSSPTPIARALPSKVGKVRRMSMGLRHTALVTDRDGVLVCGANGKGQLGLIDPETDEPLRGPLRHFTAVPELKDVKDVACGENHTVVLAATSSSGGYTTYFFGDNRHGQASLDPGGCARVCPAYRSAHPGDPRPDGAPIQIHAGWSHTCVLSDGAVYSWGRNSYGQLGRGKSAASPWKVRRVEELPSRVVQLSVGSEHNVALTDTGEIFCWGWNEHGNCGNGGTTDVPLPERLAIPSNNIGVLVGAGAGHSFAVIKKID